MKPKILSYFIYVEYPERRIEVILGKQMARDYVDRFCKERSSFLADFITGHKDMCMLHGRRVLVVILYASLTSLTMVLYTMSAFTLVCVYGMMLEQACSFPRMMKWLRICKVLWPRK